MIRHPTGVSLLIEIPLSHQAQPDLLDHRERFAEKFSLQNLTLSMTPAPTASAYLKLKPEQCTVTDVAQISKEYLNIEEDLIMLDTNGFEILDNPGTRGKSIARYRHLHGRTYQTCSTFNYHYYS